MEYLLIILLQLLGIGFHVMQKIIKFGDQYPEMDRGKIFDIFMKEDWDTLIVSILVLVTHITLHFTANYLDPDLMNTSFAFPALGGFTISYVLVSLVLALFMGYFGQRVAYKIFGTAEKYIDKKIENKL